MRWRVRWRLRNAGVTTTCRWNCSGQVGNTRCPSRGGTLNRRCSTSNGSSRGYRVNSMVHSIRTSSADLVQKLFGISNGKMHLSAFFFQLLLFGLVCCFAHDCTQVQSTVYEVVNGSTEHVGTRRDCGRGSHMGCGSCGRNSASAYGFSQSNGSLDESFIHCTSVAAF